MSALDEIVAEKPPLRKDEDGVYRVGNTRVRLETLVTAFENGCTPEEIQIKYPSLQLAEVYSVVTCYLHHHLAVDEYLKDRRRLIERTDREIEKRSPSAGLRERLLARRSPRP